MLRLWGKIIKNSRIVRDHVAEIGGNDTPTHRIFAALDEIASVFDLEKPIWLDSNVRAFRDHRKTRFTQDNFIETIPFDCLEIELLSID